MVQKRSHNLIVKYSLQKIILVETYLPMLLYREQRHQLSGCVDAGGGSVCLDALRKLFEMVSPIAMAFYARLGCDSAGNCVECFLSLLASFSSFLCRFWRYNGCTEKVWSHPIKTLSRVARNILKCMKCSKILLCVKTNTNAKKERGLL